MGGSIRIVHFANTVAMAVTYYHFDNFSNMGSPRILWEQIEVTGRKHSVQSQEYWRSL